MTTYGGGLSAVRGEALEIVGGHRPGEMVALHLVAGMFLQELELRAGLHALAHHLELEIVRERDDRLGDDALVRLSRSLDGLHERLVDLERADRQLREVRQARVTGAEVVDRKLHADLAEPLEHA